MARKSTLTASSGPAELTKPREEVRAQLLARVTAADELMERAVNSTSELERSKADFYSWDDFNYEYLRRAFTTEEYAISYRASVIGVASMTRQSAAYEWQQVRERIVSKARRITSLIERLDLIDEALGVKASEPKPMVARRPKPSPENRKVFLVHGQDEEAKAVVARFITGCGLEPIILHEQPNGSRTIIEKFEREADVGFAVILMTPDDVGGLQDGDTLTSKQLKARARQNVVLELGYFAGSLGRDRVAALKKGDIEMPSDIAGVVWTAMDATDAWKMNLARELKNAGYEFDVAKALGI